MNLDEIEQSLLEAGLSPRGAFHPAADDGVEAAERPADPGLDLLQPHVLHQHLDQVPHRRATRELQVVLGQGLVDVHRQVGVLPQMRYNLIPVHPLDGFKVLAGLLPRDWYYDFIQTERYGIFILILLLFTGIIGRILFPIVSVLFNFIMPGFSAPF